MTWMKNGDLGGYIGKHNTTKAQQLQWFKQIARTLARILARGVLVDDIHPGNFLLDEDLNVYFCDFSAATVSPEDTRMDTAHDAQDSTIQIDITDFGSFMYQVVTGERSNLFGSLGFEEDELTDPGTPPTENLWLGEIIDRCWTDGGYANADALANQLDAFEFDEGDRVDDVDST